MRRRRMMLVGGLGSFAVAAGSLGVGLSRDAGPVTVAAPARQVPANVECSGDPADPATVCISATSVVSLPDPVPVASTTTSPPATYLTVDLPGWSGAGQLYTDGLGAPRVLPGQVGRAIVFVPVDPSGAATFNLAGRQWRVVTRSQELRGDVGHLVGPRPVVPTVMLVGTNTDPLRIVEAR